MNWKRNTSCLFIALLYACGGSSDPSVTAKLKAPDSSTPHISVNSALRLEIADRNLASRIVVDEIQFNLAEARLLGMHPSLPVGGLPLIDQARLLTALPGSAAALELPFPSRYQFDDDLAVYLRVAASDELEGASVVIRARLYATPIEAHNALTMATDPDGDPDNEFGSATDPDGDPDGERTGATDPDGDPDKEVKGATDPDGDPDKQLTGATDPDGDPDLECVMCQRRELIQALTVPFIEIELRDDQSLDLVDSMAGSGFDVVLGISGSKWFDAESIEAMEKALAHSISSTDRSRAERAPDRIIVQTERDLHGNRIQLINTEGEGEDLKEGEVHADLEAFERIHIRRW